MGFLTDTLTFPLFKKTKYLNQIGHTMKSLRETIRLKHILIYKIEIINNNNLSINNTHNSINTKVRDSRMIFDNIVQQVNNTEIAVQI